MNLLKVLGVLKRLLFAEFCALAGLLCFDNCYGLAMKKQSVVGELMTAVLAGGFSNDVPGFTQIDVQLFGDLRRVLHVPTRQGELGVDELSSGLGFVEGHRFSCPPRCQRLWRAGLLL